ncbi:MAG TPA: TatD family deoxyribonuclease [Alteromonas australica]|uniref:TatD family deoxyribonuclease n=1 Tax=Alteromonas australica TaxID=589873 RepID=A0A350P5B8_9ALTE|nr:TatD family hydrolase [Alteromonas australica]MBU33369.1 TatD family deoxyribonuclease [Alteromonas sp.]AJP44245.1 DNAse [Alteromonas australica]HAI73047.1 TatD family deoxyribonuclease [Alteromonas australica]HAW76485.1 TatD family deoxyribonuclease [Alteromonas australica]HBF73166.1 TatD family deoxyribonuclease [Alteromonas australica]
MFVDSHCHLDRLKQSPESLVETLNFARTRGVEHFLCVCVSVNDYDSMLETVKDFNDVSVSCGVHPLHQDEACSYDELLEKASRHEVVAIGETGLDYFYSPESKDVQLQSFIDHIKVANETKKPLIIHTRDAREDTINLLKAHKAPHTKGVLHCFTESLEMAEAAMELDFYISISGIVTFNSAQELREVVKAIPLERLLIETDSPWLAPVPHRGKQNQPGYVVEVAEFIAELKGITVAELARITTENFYTLFSLAARKAN